MEKITLDLANQMIAAAFDFGKTREMKPLAAVVVDAGGQVVAFQRQDGSALYRLQVAAGKACGALALGMSSRKVSEIASERPSYIASLGQILPFGPVPAAGGVVVVDRRNLAIGAMAVTGDTGDNDERSTLAAIAAVGLIPQPSDNG